MIILSNNILAQHPNSNIYFHSPQNSNMADPDGINPGILLILFIGIISAAGILFKVNK